MEQNVAEDFPFYKDENTLDSPFKFPSLKDSLTMYKHDQINHVPKPKPSPNEATQSYRNLQRMYRDLYKNAKESDSIINKSFDQLMGTPPKSNVSLQAFDTNVYSPDLDLDQNMQNSDDGINLQSSDDDVNLQSSDDDVNLQSSDHEKNLYDPHSNISSIVDEELKEIKQLLTEINSKEKELSKSKIILREEPITNVNKMEDNGLDNDTSCPACMDKRRSILERILEDDDFVCQTIVIQTLREYPPSLDQQGLYSARSSSSRQYQPFEKKLVGTDPFGYEGQTQFASIQPQEKAQVLTQQLTFHDDKAQQGAKEQTEPDRFQLAQAPVFSSQPSVCGYSISSMISAEEQTQPGIFQHKQAQALSPQSSVNDFSSSSTIPAEEQQTRPGLFQREQQKVLSPKPSIPNYNAQQAKRQDQRLIEQPISDGPRRISSHSSMKQVRPTLNFFPSKINVTQNDTPLRAQPLTVPRRIFSQISSDSIHQLNKNFAVRSDDSLGHSLSDIADNVKTDLRKHTLPRKDESNLQEQTLPSEDESDLQEQTLPSEDESYLQEQTLPSEDESDLHEQTLPIEDEYDFQEQTLTTEDESDWKEPAKMNLTSEDESREDELRSEDESYLQEQTLPREDESDLHEQTLPSEDESDLQEQTLTTEDESDLQEQTLTTEDESDWKEPSKMNLTSEDESIEDELPSEDKSDLQEQTLSSEDELSIPQPKINRPITRTREDKHLTSKPEINRPIRRKSEHALSDKPDKPYIHTSGVAQYSRVILERPPSRDEFQM